MKDCLRIVIVLLLMVSCIESFSQNHKDSVAYLSKYPVKKGYAYWFKDKPGSLADPGSTISVFSKDSSVFAVTEGRVKKIFKGDEFDGIVIGGRDTFVLYANLDKFYKNVGDTIHKGDLIGTIKKEVTDDRYELFFQAAMGRKSLFCDDQIRFLQRIH